jgi:hypothetical protein
MQPADHAHPNIAPPREYAFFAGFLSYLVPGLGQIYQGRVLKGLLFMVCLLGLFFYGMKLGSWSNVYLPKVNDNEYKFSSGFLGAVYKRLPFAGQFWIGVAAWPAIWQWRDAMANRDEPSWPFAKSGEFWQNLEKEPPEIPGQKERWPGLTLNQLQADGDKSWDLGWVYTVIAGVLNILVIYDAIAGPAFLAEDKADKTAASAKGEAVPA